MPARPDIPPVASTHPEGGRNRGLWACSVRFRAGWLLSLALCFMGCASNSLYLTPRIRGEVGQDWGKVGVRHLDIRAIHGSLEVSVQCSRPDSDYAPDLTLEVRIAEELLSSLSKSEEALGGPWSNVDFRLYLQYGSGARWHATTSSLHLLVSRADMDGLRAGTLSSPQLVRRAQLRLAVKSVPGGSGLWREWKQVPGP